MRHSVLLLAVLACAAATVHADNPRQAFANAWKGKPVVVRSELYSLVYNERGRLGNTRSGRREGLLVVTSSRTVHLQFDGRQGRDTVVAADPAALVRSVSTAYQGNTLDVRPYRRLEPLAVERYVAGAELIVSAVSIERDEIKMEFALADGSVDTTTSLRIKWPLPFSPSFNERHALEDLLLRYVEIKRTE